MILSYNISMFRADDEMVTVNRGGITMTIPRNLAHHVPPVTVGHLDDEGITDGVEFAICMAKPVHCRFLEQTKN
jgi:hypothetical protein